MRFDIRSMGLAAAVLLASACGDDDAGDGDAGVSDAGVSDAGVSDAGVSDAGVSDAGVSDAGVSDAGESDAAPFDGAALDGAPDDGATGDAPSGDAEPADGGPADAEPADAEPPDAGCMTSTFYRDADGDGYGVAGMTMDACTAPIGYVAITGDCDDAAASVNPGAAEVCANGADDDCSGTPDDAPSCTIACNWTGARWLSHGWDGAAHQATGARFSCIDGRLSHVQYVAMFGTGVTPGPSGTGDALVGCNWSGDRWGSEGLDGSAAFTNGSRVSCDGTRVTGMTWESTSVAATAAIAGDLGCDWSGAIFVTHGWDGGCAFQTGFEITCHMGRITHFAWVEGCARSR